MSVNSAFHLEINVLESGRRMEIKFPQSMITSGVESIMLASADSFYGDADFLFRQDLAPVRSVETRTKWFADSVIIVPDWQASALDVNLWATVKRNIRNTRPRNRDELKAAIKATLQQHHKPMASVPCTPRLMCRMLCSENAHFHLHHDSLFGISDGFF